MLKICRQKWDENKDKLEEALRRDKGLNSCDYLHLVKKTVEIILNGGHTEYGEDYQVDKIHQIDDGDYQGTLIYLIPANTYQPSEYEYLMTYVGYGSCSGCDTLQAIQGWDEKPPTESQMKDYMGLCLHIVQNIVRPYNSGWRNDEKFEQCEENLTT